MTSAGSTAGLTCVAAQAGIYKLEWTGKYGPMEAFHANAATCERERTRFWKTSAPCKPAP